MALLITCVGGVAETPSGEKTPLPKPKPKGKVSLEEALWKRQSVRSFTDRVPTWEQVGQLLWAAQGINRPGTKFRTAPSAGALYPLELYVLLPSGIYRYLPEEHAVVKTGSQDMRNALSEAGLRQGFIQEATCVFVICAVFERTAAKYGNEATRYVLLEGGHAAQNLLLQAVAMGMAGVPIGAMISEEAQKVLRVPQEQRPIYILATGFPK
jgi:SagB-type dehydrogenase family enzyme